MSNESPKLPLPGAPDENGATIVPAQKDDVKQRDEAANIIRSKISRLYADEPDATDELEEAKEPGTHSEHQQYLIELYSSGLSMEDIQVKWHEYYQGLNAQKKHEVWQEFYANQNRHTHSLAPQASDVKLPEPDTKKAHKTAKKLLAERRKNKEKEIDWSTSGKKRTKKKLTRKHHIQSLVFGLSAGVIVLFTLMFTFFNERILLPFIQPNTIAAATPIITVPGAVVSSESKVIIPKLNVEAPVVYDVPFIQPGETADDFEERIQEGLERGVVHYPSSQLPGETGQGFNSNTVIVGHSSNNIFNRGGYKFAFMQLRQLEPGDTFMLNYNSKQYVYKVYEKKVVPPTDLSVLGPASRPNSATLITCDPPGLNINRLIIVAEQISPNPLTNVLTNQETQTTDELVVPGKPKTMWERFWGFVTGD